VPSSTEWAFGSLVPFRPTVFVDVSRTLDAKLDALGMYEAELREFPHARSVEAVEHAARRWGSTVGVEAAEAFEVVWELR
jgi:LmbE family N-acetylglucosaminyl deacetylase